MLQILQLQDVWKRFCDLCAQMNEDVPPSFKSRLSTFKQKLSESVGDIFYFYQPKNRDIHERQMLLVPRKRLHELIQTADEDVVPSSMHTNNLSYESDVMTIVHSALLCRKQLDEQPGYKGLNVSNELSRSVVPELLHLWLSVVSKGHEAVDDFFNNKDCEETEVDEFNYCAGVDSDESDDDTDVEDEEEKPNERVNDSNCFLFYLRLLLFLLSILNLIFLILDLNNRILSIAQDIVYVTSKGKKLTPKHVGLALAMHQKTRSRKLVSLFNKAGHCVTYKEVLQIDRALAEMTLESLDYSTGAVTPPNIVSCDDATKLFEGAIEPFVPVLHITADNIDLLTDTIDGKNTFHATQMVVFQRGGKSSDDSLNMIQVKKGSSCLQVPEILNFLPENQPLEEEPKFNKTVELEWYDDSDCCSVKEARTKDFTFIYTRQDKPDGDKIGWTQFNKSISTNNLPLTASGFMPLILNPAHEFNTLVTVASRCIAVADKLNYPYVVLTVDQQLHIKLLDVKWSSPIFQERLVLMMGGFHIACNYMKAIGQHMACTGLAEMWVESGVLAEGSAQKVLNGKAYAKGMRIHKLTYQALWRILLPRFLDFLVIDYYKIYELLLSLPEDDQLSVIYCGDNGIEKYVKIFLETEVKKNVNFSLWITYIECVAILLMFTRSVRDGQWKLYLTCLNKMLPLLARYDHYNYLKSLTVHIAEMKQLPDIVKTAFECGDFVVKKTNAKFNHVAADHAQEWLVGTSKDSGGIVGVTNKESTLQRWALSFHWRTEITNKTFSMYGLTPKINKHIEENPGRRKRDISDENTILKYLVHLKVLASDNSLDQLQNVATKDVATNEIQVSILGAYDEGRKTAIAFVKERLILQENESTTISFNQTISKVNALTMADLYRPVSTTNLEKKSKSVDNNFLQRLTMSFQAGRRIDLQAILKHELHKFPTSLTDVNGNLRTGDDNALSNHLCKEVHCVNTLPLNELSSHLIINGSEMMASIQKLSTTKTFGDYGNQFVSEVKKMSWNYPMVDVLFDFKIGHRIPVNNSQKRPKLLVPIRRIIESENVPLPQNMRNYLSLPTNESDLSNFLCEKLAAVNSNSTTFVVSGGFSEKTKVDCSDKSFDALPLYSNHDYAKTRVVLHAINSEAEKIVVLSKDTELLLLLIYHFDKMRCKELWLQKESSRKRVFIPVHTIVESLSMEVKLNVLSYHFLTGSYFTSYLHGIGKASGWKIYESNSMLLCGLGEPTLTSEVINSVEEFFVKLYKVDEDIKTADSARHFLFGKLKSLPDLPPTTDSLRFHIYRCHNQTQIFKNAHLNNIPAEDSDHSGWRLNNNNQWEPILSSLEAVPSMYDEMKSCGCAKGRCGDNRCFCHKKGLPCMPLCKCGGNCKNNDSEP